MTDKDTIKEMIREVTNLDRVDAARWARTYSSIVTADDVAEMVREARSERVRVGA